MDLFGIKRRRAQKEGERLSRKQREELKLKKVKAEYQALKERADNFSKQENKSDEVWADRHNNKCPKCGSTKVNDRIKRIQGEFNGEAEGSLSGFGILGTGYVSGSYHSKSHGEIDTNEVNKCECGHEWKKTEADYIYASKMLEKKFDGLKWKMETYKNALKAKVDLKDLDEKYTFDEEKRKALLESATDYYVKKQIQEFFGDTSIEAIMEIAELEIWKYSYDRRAREAFKEAFDIEFLEKTGLKHMELNA